LASTSTYSVRIREPKLASRYGITRRWSWIVRACMASTDSAPPVAGCAISENSSWVATGTLRMLDGHTTSTTRPPGRTTRAASASTLAMSWK